MASRKKVLLLDMDDVTVDQSSAWVKRIYEKTGRIYDREEFKTWDISSILPSEISRMIFEEINKEPGFFRHLPAKEGAIEGIEKLAAYYDIVFVTASEHYAYQDKYFWIRENLPIFSKPNLVLTHRKDLIAGDIFVDDGPHNLLKSPAPLKIIFDHPWNRHISQFPRVHNWSQLVEHLLAKSRIFHSSVS